MKKIVMGFAVAALLTIGSGIASADSGFWFGGGTSNRTTWISYVNVQNLSASSQTVTVTFYYLDGTLIGSTIKTLASNQGWNIGNNGANVLNGATVIPQSSFGEPGRPSGMTSANAQRGTVKIQPGNASGIYGYSTAFNTSSNSGFNFRNPN